MNNDSLIKNVDLSVQKKIINVYSNKNAVNTGHNPQDVDHSHDKCRHCCQKNVI